VIDVPGDELAVLEDGRELATVDPNNNVVSESNCLCQLQDPILIITPLFNECFHRLPLQAPIPTTGV